MSRFSVCVGTYSRILECGQKGPTSIHSLPPIIHDTSIIVVSNLNISSGGAALRSGATCQTKNLERGIFPTGYRNCKLFDGHAADPTCPGINVKRVRGIEIIPTVALRPYFVRTKNTFIEITCLEGANQAMRTVHSLLNLHFSIP